MSLIAAIRELHEQHGLREASAVVLVAERYGLSAAARDELYDCLSAPSVGHPANDFVALLQRAGLDTDALRAGWYHDPEEP